METFNESQLGSLERSNACFFNESTISEEEKQVS